MALSGSSSTQVQGTNDSSIVSKLSMINLGYEDDQYLNIFVKKPQRRSPLINRGYYIRCKAVRSAVNVFLNGIQGKKQIVSLGAGFDTTYFCTSKKFDSFDDTLYVEIDYPGVLCEKMDLACRHNLFPEENLCNASPIICRFKNYLGVGFDLRRVGVKLTESLNQNGVDFSLPTLFLSEVVLTYLTSGQSSRVLRWVNHSFENALTLVFEQMLPDDAFGHVMCRHFENIGSPLSSIHEYPTLKCQEKRHNDCCFHTCFSTDLHSIYKSLPPAERLRVDCIELFDEYEGWHQMCLHYFLLASTNTLSSSLRLLCKTMLQSVTYADESSEFGPPPPMEVVSTATLCDNFSSLQMFGHCMTQSGNTACVIGGFGIPHQHDNNKKLFHQRLNSICMVDLQSLRSKDCPVDGEDLSHTMFSSVITYRNEGKDIFLIFGGRTSPKHPSNAVRYFKITDKSRCQVNVMKNKICQNSKESSIPPPRWRHSATFIDVSSSNESPQMIVLGGRNKDLVFDDCWSLNLNTFLWHCICLKPSRETEIVPFSCRHSHSVAWWKSQNSLVLSGGLDQASHCYNDIIQITFTENCSATFNRLNVTPSLLPRYSHTSHIVKEEILLLVGGVVFPPTSLHHSRKLALQDNIAVVNLKTCTLIQTVYFPVLYLGKPLRVHGHTSAIHIEKEDEEYVLSIFGGGSNCFSFGTSFNQSPLRFSLRLDL